MKLRKPVYADKIRAETQNKFGGLRHLPQAEDGDLYDMRNLTADAYPLLQTRKRRFKKDVARGDKVNGFGVLDGHLFWSDSKSTHFEGEAGHGAPTSDSQKIYSRVNDHIVVMPDKMWIKLHGAGYSTAGELEQVLTVAAGKCGIQNGDLDGIETVGSTIVMRDLAMDGVLRLIGTFEEGDAITIQGCTTVPTNNLTAVLREVDFTRTTITLRFDENVFSYPEGQPYGYIEPGEITITRTAPEMDFVFEHENRLWGYKGSTIYASKLGDPFNWNVFDGTATDAWSTPVLSEGDITGACSYGGYPIFFKENSIIKVYGSIPSEFRVSETTAFGVKAGSALSIAEASGVLFYLSTAGVCAYTGTTPTVVSANAFPRDEVESGVGGSDTRRYYLSAITKEGSSSMLVYDVDERVWHREDAPAVVGFGCVGDVFCFMDTTGVVWSTESLGYGYKEEELLPWMAEFGDITNGTTRKKTVSKVEIRAEVKGTMTVYISHDGGEWKAVAIVTETDKRSVVIPVRPRRADHFRLRLEGDGECTVYSIATYRSVGSSK